MDDALTCHRCGRRNASLRLVIFPYVYSVVLFTSKRAAAGIWCHSCRSALRWQYGLISLLFGWWGFPWGPLYTPGALIRSFAGGQQPREENAELLEILGGQFLETG